MSILWTENVPDIKDARLRVLFEYWLSKAMLPKVALRRDIDPVDVPSVLPYIWLYRFEPETNRFICHLMGESARERFSTHVKGRYLDELLPEAENNEVSEHYHLLLERPAIGYTYGRVYGDRRGTGERILLPLAPDVDAAPTFVLGATRYVWDISSTEQLPDVVRYSVSLDRLAEVRRAAGDV